MGRRPKKELKKINFDSNKMGEYISKLRKARGLTQTELANKIGISRSSITEFERGGNRIYDEMIFRISLALDVTPNDILGFKNNSSLEEISPSLRLMKRIQKIEQLPIAQQKALLKTIDMALNAYESK